MFPLKEKEEGIQKKNLGTLNKIAPSLCFAD
jgi:hypothetical protein